MAAIGSPYRPATLRCILLALFVFCTAIFYTAPMHRVEDSRYSLLVSRDILDHATVDLTVYQLPQYKPNSAFGVMPNGYTYHLYPVGSGLYLFFPLGSSLLSLPVVWAAGHIGLSPVSPDGSFSADGEAAIEAILAAILCACVVCLFFKIAMLWLPLRYSLGLAIIGGFCTPILSTASRTLWSHTWLITLLSASIYMLCRTIRQSRAPNILLFASCVAGIYFVRPTGSIAILCISVLTYVYMRERFVPYMLIGMGWALVFVLLSKAVYGTLLPPYYALHGTLLPPYYDVNKFSGSKFLEALAGNMVSPSRGWLIYTPCLLLLGFLPRSMPRVKEKLLLVICIGAMFLQWLVVSYFPHWWGGSCYGPRLMTDVVPWMFLAFVIATAAYLERPLHGHPRWLMRISMTLTLAFTLFVNVGGAYGTSSIDWNGLPTSSNRVDDHPDRLWDWRHPQFFAGPYLGPSLPWRTHDFH
jgi:hypothetical protein